MAKCVQCVLENTRAELEKHPNEVTEFNFNRAQRRRDIVFARKKLDTLRLCGFHHPQGTALPKTFKAWSFVKERRELHAAKHAKAS